VKACSPPRRRGGREHLYCSGDCRLQSKSEGRSQKAEVKPVDRRDAEEAEKILTGEDRFLVG